MFCAEWALVKHETDRVTIIPMRCKCWTCDECRPGRKARLIAEAKAGKPNLFITLTTRRTPRGCPHAAARALVKAFRIVRREYIKKHGKGSLPFLTVFEATKRGWPHLHMVARCKWLDQRWLSKRLGELIGAPIVEVTRIKGMSQVADYIAKYIGKNPQRFHGTKRYWRSLDWMFPTADTDEKDPCTITPWQVVERDWLKVIEDYMFGNFDLEMTRHEAVLIRCKPT